MSSITKQQRPIKHPKKKPVKKVKLTGDPLTWVAWVFQATWNGYLHYRTGKAKTQTATRSAKSKYIDWSDRTGERMGHRGHVECKNCTANGESTWHPQHAIAAHLAEHEAEHASTTTPQVTGPTKTGERKVNQTKVAAAGQTGKSKQSIRQGGTSASTAPAPLKSLTDDEIRSGKGRSNNNTSNSSTNVGSWKAPTESFPPAQRSDKKAQTQGDGINTKWSSGWSGGQNSSDQSQGSGASGWMGKQHSPHQTQWSNGWPGNTGAWSNDSGSKNGQTSNNGTGATVTALPTAAVVEHIKRQNEENKGGRKRWTGWGSRVRYQGRHRAGKTTKAGRAAVVTKSSTSTSQMSRNWGTGMTALSGIASAMGTWAANPPENWEQEMAEADGAADEFRGVADAFRRRAEAVVEMNNITADCVEPYEDAAKIASEISDMIMEVGNRIRTKYGELKEAADRGEIPRIEYLTDNANVKR